MFLSASVQKPRDSDLQFLEKLDRQSYATTWLPEMVRDTLGSLLIDFYIYGALRVLQFPFELNISRLCDTKGKNPGFQVSGFQFRKEPDSLQFMEFRIKIEDQLLPFDIRTLER